MSAPIRPAHVDECDIAIVGLAGRFPGSADIAAFWSNLCAGVESITPLRADEIEDAFDEDTRASAAYVRARSILADVDLFDAGFFGMQAREADLTDPQHRVFLECCWEALEHAGCDPTAAAERIGVLAGCSINTYFLRNVLGDRARIEQFASDYQVGSYPELIGGGHDFLATRVAYKLDLRGPAMTLQSACSTSLNIVAQACQNLMTGQADVMLAGAVSITFPQARGYLYQPGGMVSADGHCRTFDARADGTVFGSGAGVVVLKRTADARANGDTIYARIRGFGINNDGSGKIGYTAPSVDGQAQAIAGALAMAHVAPEHIGYVECHGTATPLGDPIEFAALTAVFGTAQPAEKTCLLGSVKSNIGHLDVAAGMSGLIKAVLAVHSGQIPPTLHFTTPNPAIDLARSPFAINTSLVPFPENDRRRYAGVSAFGVGGTNVHLVLENEIPTAPHASPTDPQLVVVSARTPGALQAARERLRRYFATASEADFAAAAWTLQAGRRAHSVRDAFVATSAADAARRLASPVRASTPRRGEPSVAFVFPGQGAQYAGMGRGLYERVPVFRAAVDRCATILEPLLGYDIRPAIFAPAHDDALASTELAQPAIFVIEFALAQIWLDWGIVPSAMAGHSVGEFTAACIAGVLSLEDALACVAERGRLMSALPRGAMVAVRLAAESLAPLLENTAEIAAVNAPETCVAAGSFADIDALETKLAERGVPFRRLETSHAFHSAMVEAAVEPLTARMAQVRLAEPMMPYVSTVTGDWISGEEATSPDYWGRQCRLPVRFADALETLVADGTTFILEVGPGSALAALARAGAGKDRCGVASSLPTGSGDELAALLTALGGLWTAGSIPNWRAVSRAAAPRRIALPTYPFERQRHWIELPARAAAAPLPNIPIPPQEASVLAQSDSPPTVTAAAADGLSGSLEREIALVLEELSGEDIVGTDPAASFLSLGFDSLALGRFATQVQSRFGVTVSFRQLLGEFPSVATLAQHILTVRPPVAPTVAPVAEPAAVVSAPPAAAVSAPPSAATVGGGNLEALMRDQLAAMQQLMRDQLNALAAAGSAAASAPPAAAAPPTSPAPPAAPAPPQSVPPAATAVPAPPEAPSRFEVFRPGAGAAPAGELTPRMRRHIAELVARTNARTPQSKAQTQAARSVLADPRVAAGFRTEWKDMVYPITAVRAKGSRLWDADGNEYIDLLNGFGQTAFGHSPDFVVAAVARQLELGFPIGPQTELAGQVAKLFCELTGNERVTFCNTGSEAVMAALRLARTVTGRDRVAVFNGAYHGQFDEVLIKGARTSHRALPVAPGIPAQSVANMTVLPYGTPESLAWIREHAAELAAIVVEPVQSRHPALVPKEFLAEIRDITRASGTALVFDEVVTGFRVHPGGMQAVFGIRADLATYGKVVGGGMPIGILAGTSRFMDALDGGMWNFGDDSIPEVAPTFFAGTFVRHPLVMAAVLAVLQHLQAAGPALQAALTERTAGLVDRLNADLARRGLNSRIETFGSLFYFNFSAEEPLAGLLYYHLRNRGVYIQEGFPCFLTTAHTAADVDHIVEAFSASLDELAAAGIFMGTQPAAPHDFALTEEQTEIWLAAQLGDEASAAFNESITLRLRGSLDRAAFSGAWNDVLRRHDALRATLSPTGETMTVTPALLDIAVTDLSASDDGSAQAELATAIEREARTPFDMVEGPLVRAELFALSPSEHVFVLTAHHIVCDGWSMNVMLGEFAELYAARQESRAAVLGETLAFSDYALMQHERDSAERAKIEAFWLAQYADPVQPLELPADRPRPAMKAFNGATRTAAIDAAAYRSIKAAGARTGCTLFVTLLGAFTALVGRLADATDVVVGVPAAGQSLVEDRVLVGHCVDFLPIRTRWTAQTKLSDLLQTVRRNVLDAYEHQSYTLGTLVRKLGLQRGTQRIPLTEIQFNLERLADDLHVPNLQIAVEPNPKAFVNFDLFLNVIESDAGLRIDCDYNTDLFDAATIDRWLGHFRTLLDAIAAGSENSAGRVSLLAEDERRAMLVELNSTAGPGFGETTINALVEAQTAQRPDALAVVAGAASLTYAQLDARATELAGFIRSRIGTAAGPVGICVSRGVNTLVALLAALKAGCGYVPLDPAHPEARLTYIAENAAVSGIITDTPRGTRIAATGIPVIDLVRDAAAIAGSQRAPVGPTPDSIAYTIYTSGSTGVPKGVEVTHRSVVNLLAAMAHAPGIASSDVFLAVTTISFDIAALELFLPLVAGATVVIAPSETTVDGLALAKLIASSGANVMQATPSTWRMLLEAGFESRPGFRMLVGGEALSRELADRLLAGGGEVWNMYGPTETTIWSSCKRIVADGSPISVGGPILNTQFYVLDANDEPVPIGKTGQLHIGGTGVARGYVKLPELTAEKFVANPFAEGRMYRTGDAARLLPSGEFIIIGRLDDQIKLRGYRIELGEIESALLRHTNLGAVAAMLREDTPGEVRLVAYYVERPEWPETPATLREALAAHLPDYMIPSLWCRLDAMPVNTNGKLDRGALPAPEAPVAPDERYVEPKTPTELLLAEIWSEALQLERVGTNDDIFELGADSIHLFRITARANKRGLRVAAKQLIRHRTIAELARSLEIPMVDPSATPARTDRSLRLVPATVTEPTSRA